LRKDEYSVRLFGRKERDVSQPRANKSLAHRSLAVSLLILGLRDRAIDGEMRL